MTRPRTLARATGRLGAGLAAGLATALLLPGAALAAEQPDAGPVISYVEPTDEGLQVLVSVPAGGQVDLEGVTASVGGDAAEATARATDDSTDDSTVRRTTVLAIDTSNSMRGERFAAAQAAAETFLATAPADVEVGIVTFAGEVELALPPTTDRARARETLDGLELSSGTRLYDGLVEAVDALGVDGQRKLLVLSDGADTSRTPMTDVTGAVEAAEVLVDVIGLDQSAQLLAPLESIATSGEGAVISADPEALREAFAAEADELSRQVLVTVAVPETVTDAATEVAVSLPTASGPLVARAYATVQAAAPAAAGIPVSAEEIGLALPGWAMYAGLGALGIGLLVVLLVLVPRRPVAEAADARIARYAGATGHGGGETQRAAGDDPLAGAKGVAASVLERNSSLEDRIAKRLEGAGSGYKPAEWALLQLGVFLASGLVGLALGSGNMVIGLICLVAGLVLPWFWLGRRKSKRLKAFNSQLPDTLSLMSGSLSAGLSLAQSVDTIVREGSEPISGEFKRVLIETRLGVPLEDALEGICERFDSDDFSWVVMAIKIQRQVGGNLAELLDTVAATMRERDYLRRQVQTLSAEGRLSAYILGGLPPMFMFYLFLTQRDYVMPLFTEPVGWLLLAAASTLLGVGSLWMKKTVSVEV